MRRFIPVVVLLFLLALPAGSSARQKPPHPGPSGDGSLSVRNGRGEIVLNLKGAVIGRVGVGKIDITDKTPFDQNQPDVRGAVQTRVISETTTRYIGAQIRFRVLAGGYRLKIDGSDVQLSAVGRGWATLQGDDRFVRNGMFSLNGGPYMPIPLERTRVQIVLPYGP